jgi:chorismate synthase
MLRYLTAGESHGKCLTGVIDGLPHGIVIDLDFINCQLRRRQRGYGRGGRMKIESDQLLINSGVRQGITLGSPLSFSIENKDWDHWRTAMSTEQTPDPLAIRSVSRPRPGHADLSGALKYHTHDIRDILERASARETTVRVAVGAFCRLFLSHFAARIASHVVSIGSERVSDDRRYLSMERILQIDPESPVRCADPEAEKRMMALIDNAKAAGDTLGGCIEVVAGPVPPGLGSHVQWDRKLDGLIAQAMMSIPSVKGVEIGEGISGAEKPGSQIHDEIFFDSTAHQFFRKTNRAGGIEGGISNGGEIRARIYIKPIPTLLKPLKSVDMNSKEALEATIERSDVCVVPAAGVIAEAMLGIVLANAFLDKFGGDSIREITSNYRSYLDRLNTF